MFKTKTRNKRIIRKYKRILQQRFRLESHAYCITETYGDEPMCGFDAEEYGCTSDSISALNDRIERMERKYGLG